MTSSRQMFNVFLFMMEHRIPNAKVIYIDGEVNIMFDWDQDRFDHGNAIVLRDYQRIMPILEALAEKEAAHQKFENALKGIL